MLREFLNRSQFLWAFDSNGLKLPIRRNNANLTRQTHVEFDLEVIFDGEAFADPRLLGFDTLIERVGDGELCLEMLRTPQYFFAWELAHCAEDIVRVARAT
jgi:hypothetical protein